MKTNHKDRVMTKAHQAYLDNHPNKEEIEQFKKSQSYQPVPTEITKDSRLSKTAKLLYGVILASDRSGLGCLMKNKTLQAWMDNISQPALWYQLNSLRSVGAIEIAKDPKTKQRVIIPLVRILKNSDEPVAESNKPGLLKPISPAYYPPQNNEAERPEITGKSRRQLSPKIRYKDKGIPDIPLRGNLKSPLRGLPKPKPLAPSKLTCSKWAEDLLHYWNSLPSAKPKHRPGTKALATAGLLLDALLQGKIGHPSNGYKLSPSFVERHHLQEHLGKPWTSDDIKAWMRQMALTLQPEYWPEDKNKIPGSLAEIIYNPRQQTSWAFLVRKHGVLPVGSKAEANGVEQLKADPKVTMVFDIVAEAVEDCKGGRLQPEERDNVYLLAKKLIVAHTDIAKDPVLTEQMTGANYRQWFVDYGEWIRKTFSGWSSINPAALGPGTRGWRDWQRHFRNLVEV